MSRPGTGRRIDIRRSQIYDGGRAVAPFAWRLIHANYADRGVLLAGTDVAGWEDVVGNRDMVQADTTKDPLYGLFTSQRALVFDDANDFMASPSVSLSAYSQITIAFAAAWTATGTGILWSSSIDPTSNAGAFYVFENGATYIVNYRNAAANVQRTAAISAGVHRFIFVLDVAGASAIPTLYVDGVSSGSAPAAANVALGNYVHYLGMFGGTSLPWSGKMGDSLIYGDALSVAEIAAVDAFLASRCT